IMHQVLAQRAIELQVAQDDLTPEQWLEMFYEQRKGSGKRSSRSTARAGVA
ncbi:hypothetical protein HH299_03945, partial [Xanthomonas sp. Kuri4-2]